MKHIFHLIWLLTVLVVPWHVATAELSTSAVLVTTPVWSVLPLPLVTIEALDAHGAEPGETSDSATFLIVRTGETNSSVRVYYSISGSASNGVDYALIEESALIPPGEYSVTVTIHPFDDLLPEGRESVRLTLRPGWEFALINHAIGALPIVPYSVGCPSSAAVIIADNDGGPANHLPVVTITTPTDGRVYPESHILLSVAANDPDGHVVSIEYFEGTNSLGIVSNAPPGACWFTILPLGIGSGLLVPETHVDLWLWPVRPVSSFVQLRYWAAGEYVFYAKATDNDGASTISDPVRITVVPRPRVTIEAIDAYASEPRGRTRNRGVFRIARTGTLEDDLVVHGSTSGTADPASDYEFFVRSDTGSQTQSNAFPLIIPAGRSSIDVVIQPLHDVIAEETETVTFRIAPAIVTGVPIEFGEGVVVEEISEATVFIRDNDGGPRNRLPDVRIVEPSRGQTFAAGTGILIVAETVDVDSYVLDVEFFEGVRRIGSARNYFGGGTGTPQQFAFQWNDVRAGWHAVRVRATDAHGGVRFSKPLLIRVRKAP